MSEKLLWTEEESRKKYVEIVQANGIEDEILDMKILVPQFAGDNFASKCETVTIKFKNVDIPLELFAKKAMQDNSYSQILKNIQLYEKEAGFFNSLLPAFREFCREKSSGNVLKNLLPKCYYADESLVVLENLVDKGFKMLDKKDGHNFEQAVKVMNNFAKLHAVSYCLIEEMGKDKFLKKFPFTKQSSLWSAEGEKVHGPWVNGTVRGAVKTLENYPVDGSSELLEFLYDYQRKGYLDLCKYFDVDNQSCGNVLNHGDAWNCNILFRPFWEQNDIVVDTQDDDNCIFIDLQTIHVGSPVLDLLYYLFLSVKKPVRRQSWRTLIEIYYDKFKGYVQQLKCTVTFSFEDLMEDIRNKCKPACVLGLYVVFGWEILDGFGDPDSVEGLTEAEVAEILNSTMCATICNGISGREEEFSKLLVEGFQEYKIFSNAS